MQIPCARYFKKGTCTVGGFLRATNGSVHVTRCRDRPAWLEEGSEDDTDLRDHIFKNV